MCGIAGIMDIHGVRDINRDALKRMTDSLAHRGPDGEGFFYDEGLGLGHRRLAIIDPEGGHQPFVSASGSTILNFNGEIYNFQSLKAEMQSSGFAGKTNSDTEVLTELWEQKSRSALDDLNGMFAISAWHKPTKTLTLARDRLGEKPLYYYLARDGFLYFASELPALLASGAIPKVLSFQAVADYFAFGYVPDPKTIYDGVLKLSPGSILAVPQGSGQLAEPERYWHVPAPVIAGQSFHQSEGKLVELLDSAVKARMIADVPIGAFLSGGVDSSAIVASMALQSAEPVHTTTIGFGEASHDERTYASEIATLYDTHHTEKLASIDVLALIDKIAGIYGEPFADSSALPTYLVCQKAREEVTVALSGDGGDEVFAGYRRYPFFQMEELVRSALPGFLRRPLFSALGSIYPRIDRAPRPLRLKSTLQSLSEPSVESYFRSVSINRIEAQQQILSADLAHHLNNYSPRQIIEDLFRSSGSRDPLWQAQFADLHTWLPGRMLVKTDRASMAVSLEVRPPLLDHRMVEWAATLPSGFKLRGRNGKRILKHAMLPRIPRDILYRPKQGFDAPVSAWLRQSTHNPLNSLNDSPQWKTCGLINEEAVNEMIGAHQSGQRDFGQELWSVVMFNAFLAAT